ncbi:MAG: acyl-CoA thioesterase [SAR324 cluster bacterium]|jgi:4-hydroxybenzoyl-CoA thioesterase|nr:acyl-CoA thioesterase [SAR324 cluster bacterium]HIF69530.1 acyl-CoA thioesterase [Candidatus Lambdaproteobacteria bacterium]HIL15338.1 acyl-CoA thioesterase [Deltaproteobacteria bacterium]
MPFIQSRIVRWGDCDPAGIIYTPRILDYAIETVETCLREVMGASWNVMREQHNIGGPTVHFECDIRKPLAPDMAVDLVLTLEKLGRSSMTSRIVCVDAEGVEYFRVLLVNCFVTGDSPTDIRALPISETWRERLKTLITENATEDG